MNNLEDIIKLDKTEKIEKLISNVKFKYDLIKNVDNFQNVAGISMSIMPNLEIEDNILEYFFEKIEEKIYYITNTPSYVFNGAFKSVYTTSLTIEGLIDVINKRKDEYIIFYNIQKNTLSNNYFIRCSFEKDPDPGRIWNNFTIFVK